MRTKIHRGMHVEANFGGGYRSPAYVKSIRKRIATISFHPGGEPSLIATARINTKHLKRDRAMTA